MTERAFVQNAADPQQVKKARQRAQRERDQERADLEAVLTLDRGRRFLWRLLTIAGVFQVSFRTGQPDLSAFMEGRREFGLILMAEIAAVDPEYYHRMAKEAQAMEQQRQPEPINEQQRATKQAETEEEM